ncbi:hypothetical protein [Ornithinimicrobium cerasi]|uniref:hypothetical protein n=1 Tax=Ornithinimicrobium cerasi TaxID=2248773 RepID=UPI000F009C67|nr:hypothetical protein [Ornithinimicrobium cerasi]
MSEESALLGSQLWCSDVGKPVEVQSIAWRQSKGVDIVDYAVVNQEAHADRLGFAPGKLAHELPDYVGSRGIRASCQDLNADGEPGPESRVSYLVLQLRLSDPEAAGAAEGLIVKTAAGEDQEPVSVLLCPAGQDPCEAESADGR